MKLINRIRKDREMHRIITIGAALLVFLALIGGHSTALDTVCDKESDASKEIETTIRQYFTSMSKRDAVNMRAVLATKFVAIEAANPDANIEVIDIFSDKKILPPQGNNDWNNIEISDAKAKLSATNASIAIASFDLVFPQDERKIAQYKNIIKREHPKLHFLNK